MKVAAYHEYCCLKDTYDSRILTVEHAQLYLQDIQLLQLVK